MPLFSAREGTPMTELIRSGTLSVLSLGRLGEDLRTVLTTTVVRKLRKDRTVASQVSRRLALQNLDASTRAELVQELTRHVPRTILAIDEAQILMGQKSTSSARRALDSFVLEGRNYGLSLWLATQRPKGAISDAAASQIDTFIVHRLSINEDINAVCSLLQNARPDKIRKGSTQIEIGELIRSLDVGQAIISSAMSDAPRLIVATIRPRMVAHGGEAF
jgi:DNA helicase HerA-like ATPase